MPWWAQIPSVPFQYLYTKYSCSGDKIPGVRLWDDVHKFHNGLWSQILKETGFIWAEWKEQFDLRFPKWSVTMTLHRAGLEVCGQPLTGTHLMLYQLSGWDTSPLPAWFSSRMWTLPIKSFEVCAFPQCTFDYYRAPRKVYNNDYIQHENVKVGQKNTVNEAEHRVPSFESLQSS